ncbi:MAG TPA: hypothetical protein VIN72_10030 [Lutibacter sp.]
MDFEKLEFPLEMDKSEKLIAECNKNINSFDSHLEENYGKTGTESRDKFEEEFETFKIGMPIQEVRKKTTFDSGRTSRQS